MSAASKSKKPSKASDTLGGSADSRYKISVKTGKRKTVKPVKFKGQPYDPGTSPT